MGRSSFEAEMYHNSRIRYIFSAFLICLLPAAPATEQDPPKPNGFGGYSSLAPKQKRLVDDWFQRFSSPGKKGMNPAQAYEKLSLSARSTFSAVTHALMRTGLTDRSGKRLAEAAIDLVDKVDNIAGEILGASGDEQFRIYVRMKPDALRLLNQSREFKHTADNRIFHRGYPLSYRSRGRPSIQVSLTRDATRADIDVDYRSSIFPVFLMNGHLRASNSDVRAGNNDLKHSKQWAGLQNWWRNLLGLPMLESAQSTQQRQVIPQESGRKVARPDETVFDFLNSWLVEQKPNRSLAYVAEEACACMDSAKGTKVDSGTAKITILKDMQYLNERVGKISSLGEVSTGVALTGDRLKVIEQPHRSEFFLYNVREDLADELECSGESHSSEIPTRLAKSKAFGKYVGAIFRINTKGQQGRVIATLWRKDHSFWKMSVSYTVDPKFDRSRSPNTGTTPVTLPAPLRKSAESTTHTLSRGT